MISRKLLKLGLPLCCVLMASLESKAQTTTEIALQNLAHAVDSLDKTVPFYRDVIGLPVNGTRDPLTQQPQALDDDMSKFTATKGAKFRAATFRIPNANFGFELTEFSGMQRRAAQPRIQDIGSATLALEVRDMDKIVERFKGAGATIVSSGGTPVNPTGNTNSKLREIVIRDPDGFFVEIQQPDPLPVSAAATTGDILGASIQLSIEDTARTVAFLRDAIGFAARPSGQMTTNPVVVNLINLPGAQWRITHGSIPATTADFGLIEYRGIAREKFSLGAADPGSPAFTMVVRDIDAAVEQWTKAGGTVFSAGGKPIKRANGAGNVFVRDVNWLHVGTHSAGGAIENKLDAPHPNIVHLVHMKGDGTTGTTGSPRGTRERVWFSCAFYASYGSFAFSAPSVNSIAANPHFSCAVKRCCFTVGKSPGNWI